MINVTQTFLPPEEEYQKYLHQIWETKWLTNRGYLVKELEQKIKNKYKLSNITLTSNGTLPIQIAIKILANKGEVITTPFSYVATTTSILWENATPIFVDIDPEYLTIDESKIEKAITSKTTAILVTHVFGNPCNVLEIDRIAKKYNLKVIYDAAHSFGTTYKGKSIFNYGDVSTCSFHATKLFHTGEGGCMVTNDKDLHKKLYLYHNFGHKGYENFETIGTNAKMSELQSAMGLAVFPYLDFIISERKKVVEIYLKNLNKNNLSFLKIREETEWNYHYFPVIFKSEKILLKVIKNLNDNNIFPRRYFYPSLNKLPYLNNKVVMLVSEDLSKRILCLPLFVGLETEKINKITSIINKIVC